jgi:hypothetical protein
VDANPHAPGWPLGGPADRVTPPVTFDLEIPASAGRRLAALAVAVGVLGLGGPAAAAGPREAQAKRALKQALEDDYLQTRFDRAEKRLRTALQLCGTSGCSAPLKAKLHAALGAVLAGGKKELDDARDAFIEALKLDPTIEPNPNLLSTEVSFAFEQAKKARAGSKPAPAKPPPPPPEEPREPEAEPPPPPQKADKDTADAADKDTADKDKDTADKDKAPGDDPPPARKNWITFAFQTDVSLISGNNVCTQANQTAEHYVCVRQDAQGSLYKGTPTMNNGDNINAGLSLSTLRVLLGYERLVHPNLTLGARVGFAFNGASGGGATFLPLHLEARLGIWPGHDPFVGRGVRPYFFVAGGLGEVDTKLNVKVLEDGMACGAATPSDINSPCMTQEPNDDRVEPRQQTLTVFKQAGTGFVSGGFGLQFAPGTRVALHLAARATVTLPVTTFVLSPEAGVSVGF